jgi:hypothetical protein
MAPKAIVGANIRSSQAAHESSRADYTRDLAEFIPHLNT